ncbi:MAG: HEPN domain-containing protein [Gammaproteobacteria bacterium]
MTPETHLAKAHRALESAELLLSDGDQDGACNRAYYAMFDAAHAALLHTNADLNPATIKTHRGLMAAFGETLVVTGRVAPELGRALNQVERIRLLADYTGEPLTVEQTRWAINQARLFVDRIDTLVG